MHVHTCYRQTRADVPQPTCADDFWQYSTNMLHPAPDPLVQMHAQGTRLSTLRTTKGFGFVEDDDTADETRAPPPKPSPSASCGADCHTLKHSHIARARQCQRAVPHHSVTARAALCLCGPMTDFHTHARLRGCGRAGCGLTTPALALSLGWQLRAERFPPAYTPPGYARLCPTGDCSEVDCRAAAASMRARRAAPSTTYVPDETPSDIATVPARLGSSVRALRATASQTLRLWTRARAGRAEHDALQQDLV